jgi:hypothetical protein
MWCRVSTARQLRAVNNDQLSIPTTYDSMTAAEKMARRRERRRERILFDAVDVVRKDGYEYSRSRFMRERKPKLLGWNRQTSSAVLALYTRKAASADQKVSWSVTYVLVRREEKRGVVLTVDGKVVTKAIRRSPHDPIAAVRAAEQWLWPVSKRQRARSEHRFDLLITRESGVPLRARILKETQRLIGTRHRLEAQEIAECDGQVFGLCPTLRAVNGDYPAFCGEYAWYSFRLPRRLTAPTGTSSAD